MAATLGAFDAANVTYFGTATTSVSAAKPVGLQAGDLWIIWHCRRGAGVTESPYPTDFVVLGDGLPNAGNSQGANLTERIYYKFANESDVLSSGVNWTQDVSAVTATQSFYVRGGNPTPFGAMDPTFALDPSAGTSHTSGGIGGAHNSLALLFSAAAVTATTQTAPTTQGGGWTEHSDVQSGSTTGTRIAMAVYHKSRVVADGVTGDVTWGSSASVITNSIMIPAFDGSSLDVSLLADKKLELKQAAAAESNARWRGSLDTSPDLVRDAVIFKALDDAFAWMEAKAAGSNPAAPEMDSADIDTYEANAATEQKLKDKLEEAELYYFTEDATALADLTWTS